MHPLLNVAVEAAHSAANIQRRQMQRVARQASLDPEDGIEL